MGISADYVAFAPSTSPGVTFFVDYLAEEIELVPAPGTGSGNLALLHVPARKWRWRFVG